MIQAQCADCGKSFRVPRAGKSYRCKACGGLVSAVHEVEHDGGGGPAAELIDCPACGEMHAADARFCEECGASMGPGQSAPNPREKARERAEASRELKRADKIVTALRMWFGTSALIWTSLLLLAFPAMSERYGVANVVLLAVAVVVHLVVVVYIKRAPFAFVLLLACVSTTFALLRLFTGGLDGAALRSMVWAALYWVCLVPVAKVGRILREHPDLWAARRFTGDDPRAHAEGRSARRRAQDRQDLQRARSRRRMLAIAGGVVALLAMGLGYRAYRGRPAPYEARIAEFREAWATSEPARVAGFARERSRAKFAEGLENIARRKDWGETYPRLSAPRVLQVSRVQLLVSFETIHGHLETNWAWEDGAWRMISLDPPD